MAYRRSISNGKISLIIFSLMMMYCMNPFYFVDSENICKYVYYTFSILSLPLFIFTKSFVKRIDLKLTCMCTIYLVWVVLLSLRGDTTYLIYLIRLVQRLLSVVTVCVIWKLFVSNKEKVSLEKMYLTGIFLYSVSTFIFIASPSIKKWWLGLIVVYQDKHVIDYPGYITRVGIAGWSSFDISVYVAFGIVYCFYIWKEKKVSNLQYICMALYCVCVSLFYARTGFTISLMLLLFCVIHDCVNGNRKTIVYLMVIFILLIVVVGVMGKTSAQFREVLDWMMEFIKKKGQSASTNELKSMYNHFSPSLKTILVGDGKWIDGKGYYGKVDVGVLRNILYGGVFYAIYKYAVCGEIIRLCINKLDNWNKTEKRFLELLVFVLFAICELKGDLLFYNLKLFIPFYWLMGNKVIVNNRSKHNKKRIS